MKHQEIINLLNDETLLNLWQETRTLSKIIRKPIIKKEIKLSIIQKIWNLIFLITTMFAF